MSHAHALAYAHALYEPTEHVIVHADPWKHEEIKEGPGGGCSDALGSTDDSITIGDDDELDQQQGVQHVGSATIPGPCGPSPNVQSCCILQAYPAQCVLSPSTCMVIRDRLMPKAVMHHDACFTFTNR